MGRWLQNIRRLVLYFCQLQIVACCRVIRLTSRLLDDSIDRFTHIGISSYYVDCAYLPCIPAGSVKEPGVLQAVDGTIHNIVLLVPTSLGQTYTEGTPPLVSGRP